MKFHIVGNRPAGQQIPDRERTSLAVAQFVELIRGERAVQAPRNLFRVEAVRAEEHYCFRCFGVRWFDVIYPVNPLWKTQRRCRCCRKEGSG